LILLAAAALLVAACSVGRLAYLNAPPLALWYLGGYVDMSDEQKSFVKDRLTKAIAWHRQAELPEYQRAIELLIAKIEGRMTAEEARSTWKLVRGYYDRSLEHLLPDMADFVLMLDESQVARIENKFAEDNRKVLRDSVKGTPDERRERRARKFVEQFEDWTGRLSSSQREIVFNGTRSLSDLTEDRVGDRRYRQTEFVRLVREKPPREKLIAELRRLLVETDTWRRPEYLKKIREREERVFEIVAELSATLTPEQRVNVQKKMRTYARDISSIIAANEAPGDRRQATGKPKPSS
jgi:hypothetical protein